MKEKTLTQRLKRAHGIIVGLNLPLMANLMPIPTPDEKRYNPIDNGIEKGKLVKGKLERGADGIKRMYTETPKQNKYYTITQDPVTKELKSEPKIIFPNL